MNSFQLCRVIQIIAVLSCRLTNEKFDKFIRRLRSLLLNKIKKFSGLNLCTLNALDMQEPFKLILYYI